jgi:hypothetical protein
VQERRQNISPTPPRKKEIRVGRDLKRGSFETEVIQV